jgi:hypothetical protein
MRKSWCYQHRGVGGSAVEAQGGDHRARDWSNENKRDAEIGGAHSSRIDEGGGARGQVS